MTLSGGGLALSLAFVKDIAENPTHTCLLKTAWVLLAASLFLVLASFLVSQAAFQWEIKQLDEGADQRARGGGWGKGVVALNTSSALALAGGAVFLVLFAMYNI